MATKRKSPFELIGMSGVILEDLGADGYKATVHKPIDKDSFMPYTILAPTQTSCINLIIAFMKGRSNDRG